MCQEPRGTQRGHGDCVPIAKNLTTPLVGGGTDGHARGRAERAIPSNRRTDAEEPQSQARFIPPGPQGTGDHACAETVGKEATRDSSSVRAAPRVGRDASAAPQRARRRRGCGPRPGSPPVGPVCSAGAANASWPTASKAGSYEPAASNPRAKQVMRLLLFQESGVNT